MIAGSSVAAVVSDATAGDYPIIACNDAFVRLTGYPREQVIGRNCRFLRGPETEPHLTEELRSALRERRATLVEITNYRRDGSRFRNAIMLAPLFDPDGEVRYILGSQFDVSTPRTDQPAKSLLDGLSDRQRAVLQRMAAGLMNKQIAFELGVSERTVKLQRSALLKALGCRTTAEAIRVAIEAGL
ncbi:PAS domain-containing protein [Sphingomonas turrisvirgatae]|nr:PAS domain-containing protein [Sphingomonas turrisvirgatae]